MFNDECDAQPCNSMFLYCLNSVYEHQARSLVVKYPDNNRIVLTQP